jgi:organic radical activating enzyme
MVNEYFPIKKGVACQLKWTWNTVRLAEGTSACCHRVQPIALDLDNFDNFHNDPVWISHRKMQLEGKFPQQGCQICEHVEAQGGVSDRLFHLTKPGLSPPELETDPEAVEVTPRVLEIFINNACNLACIYCDESNSTRIAKENQKFGYTIPGEIGSKKIIPIVPKTVDYQPLLAKFYQYLDKNYQHLRELNVLGGEPFYQKEFSGLIDFIINRKNQDLTFTVVSNLMVSQPILEDFVDKMKHALVSRKVKRVDITASIDCWGPEQEYVRYGIDLSQWMKNFEYLAKHKWLYIKINNTVTNLTIKTLPELIKYVNDLRKTRQIHHAFGLVDGRPHLHPGIFNPGFFDNDFDRILSQMPNQTQWEKHQHNYMMGMQSSINNHVPDNNSLHNLKCYLTEIDRRRGTDWKTTFSWLQKELEHVV